MFLEKKNITYVGGEIPVCVMVLLKDLVTFKENKNFEKKKMFCHIFSKIHKIVHKVTFTPQKG